MHWLAKGLVDLLFPPRCLVCRRFDQAPLCPACAAQVQPIAPPLCRRCGFPFDPQAQGGPVCASCRRSARLPFDLARSAARYEWPLRPAVHQLKYQGKRVLGRVLGEMMASLLLDGDRGADAEAPGIPFHRLSLIVPVPLHPVRSRERGFNQAELLCWPLAQRIETPIAIHCLQRTRLNPPQVALPAPLRRANVRDAFAVTDPAAVAGRSVLLFDDVWTTGATLLECARLLRRAGAAEVYVLTLCRAIPG